VAEDLHDLLVGRAVRRRRADGWSPSTSTPASRCGSRPTQGSESRWRSKATERRASPQASAKAGTWTTLAQRSADMDLRLVVGGGRVVDAQSAGPLDGQVADGRAVLLFWRRWRGCPASWRSGPGPPPGRAGWLARGIQHRPAAAPDRRPCPLAADRRSRSSGWSTASVESAVCELRRTGNQSHWHLELIQGAVGEPAATDVDKPPGRCAGRLLRSVTPHSDRSIGSRQHQGLHGPDRRPWPDAELGVVAAALRDGDVGA
jgi:hypothetical protein